MPSSAAAFGKRMRHSGRHGVHPHSGFSRRLSGGSSVHLPCLSGWLCISGRSKAYAGILQQCRPLFPVRHGGSHVSATLCAMAPVGHPDWQCPALGLSYGGKEVWLPLPTSPSGGLPSPGTEWCHPCHGNRLRLGDIIPGAHCFLQAMVLLGVSSGHAGTFHRTSGAVQRVLYLGGYCG